MKIEPFVDVREKPWGDERVLTPVDLPYVGKIIHVSAGKKLSLQYHTEKEETITLVHGKAILWTAGSEEEEPEKVEMEELKGYTVRPGTVHRLEAVTDCRFVENSTPERGITVRLQDDYGRPDEVRE